MRIKKKEEGRSEETKEGKGNGREKRERSWKVQDGRRLEGEDVRQGLWRGSRWEGRGGGGERMGWGGTRGEDCGARHNMSTKEQVSVAEVVFLCEAYTPTPHLPAPSSPPVPLPIPAIPT